jgi:homoserine O-acetyltransferase
MEVLMWAALYAERVNSVICMASAAALPAASLAWHLVGRKMILADPDFADGDYYDHGRSLRGLELARMVGHMTYRSDEALEKKFGRRRRDGTRQFEIDSYLEYQGKRFARTYDPNCYIRVQTAMDEMDLEEQFGTLDAAFRSFHGRRALLVSFDTDWLFPSSETARVHHAMRSVGVEATHLEFSTPNGHDAFLLDYHLINDPVAAFLVG